MNTPVNVDANTRLHLKKRQMRLPREQALEAAEDYRVWLYKTARCCDCGKMHYYNQDKHYVLIVCKPCLEKSSKMPYEGDHIHGKKDHRASLRRDGQEGNDYFG